MALILVIDDETPIRTSVRRVLEDAGHTVLEADGGRKGIELLRQRPADLVITDILMPDMEGIETIRAIRKTFPAARIIAMSGGGGSGPRGAAYLHAAAEFGADAILAKPFRMTELLESVTRLLAPQK